MPRRNPNSSWIELLLLTSLVTICGILLSSCYSGKIAVHQIRQVNSHNNILIYQYRADEYKYYLIYCSKDGLSTPVCALSPDSLKWPKKK